MAIASLIGKDAREHGATALVLCCATLFIVVLAFGQNQSAAYSMSPFEVVRFALLSFMPLIALVVGNRLVVREYLNSTRLFVEALPVDRWSPLVLKYLLGLLYLCFLAVLMLGLAASLAGQADEVDRAYFSLLLLKTIVMICLYWSIVFCFSLCGHLRVVLYLIVLALVLLISFYPGMDSSRFAPFELMDDQLFVFERDSLAILAIGGMLVWSSILENTDAPSVEFTGEHVLRSDDPRVSVLYLEPEYLKPAQLMHQRLVESLSEMRSRLGLVNLPAARLSLDDSREKHDIFYSTLEGVLISANYPLSPFTGCLMVSHDGGQSRADENSSTGCTCARSIGRDQRSF